MGKQSGGELQVGMPAGIQGCRLLRREGQGGRGDSARLCGPAAPDKQVKLRRWRGAQLAWPLLCSTWAHTSLLVRMQAICMRGRCRTAGTRMPCRSGGKMACTCARHHRATGQHGSTGGAAPHAHALGSGRYVAGMRMQGTLSRTPG